ncbi:MAG TPA: SxtJ family membrane protein [Geminicoccaceae bacterium]|nr:SxtJ family membrane protein [Geminicoccaceae bacterium]
MAGSFHESYRENADVKAGSDRAFGLTVGGILSAIALYRWLFGASGLDWLTLLLGLVGLALLATGLLAARHLAPLNRAWTRLGLLLFKVVNPVVMFLIFAVAIVPIGWVMRLAGHDPMRLKRDPAASSYWIERRPPGPPPETMINQF